VHGAMRKTDVFWRAGWLTAICAGLLGMVACGSADNSPAPAASSSSFARAKAHKPPKPVASKPGEDALNDMVAAVSASKAGPPIELRFSLPTRPEVGQVMDVVVAVVPHAPVPDRVSVSFQVVEGLEIVDGAQMESSDKLMDGIPLRHVVKVIPKRDGIFAISATVNTVSGNQDLNRTFSIPVIAGQGLPDQVAKGT
jgi:hypothetical protein